MKTNLDLSPKIFKLGFPGSRTEFLEFPDDRGQIQNKKTVLRLFS